MSAVKVVIIGGGSVNWIPTILTDLVITPELEGSTAALMDIDEEALELATAFGRRLVEASGRRWTLEATTDRREALRGADFVVLTIAVGGLDAMEHDLAIPLRYGIYQSVGDTVGPGGLSRALRNIPVVYEIARDMEALCPQAWLLNYTNPMTTLTRTVSRHTSVKVIGLCHELTGVLHRLRRLLDLGEAAIDVTAAGINHFIWLLRFEVDGRDGYDLLRVHLAEDPVEFPYRGELSGDIGSVFRDRLVLKLRLFEMFGVLPAAGDRHLAEFLPFVLTDAAGRGAHYGVELTTVDHRRTLMALGREYVRRLARGEEPLRLARSQEAVAEIICALAGGREHVHIVNLPNEGQIADLPPGAVVETMGHLSRDAAKAIPAGELPPALLAMLYPHVVRQEMIVEAGMAGDRRLALQALATDPLVANPGVAAPMLDELLKAHRAWLPQF